MTQAQPEDWRPWEAEEIARARTDARQARWGLRAALALLAVLALGTLAWWLGEPGAPPEPPQAATAIGTIAAPAAAPAPQPEAQSTRVVTVKTDTFTLTVDRPAAPQPAPVVAANPPQPEGRLRHRVVRGDTLWEIAEHYLGNAARYPELARVSGIRDPNLIYPGDIVTIDTVTPGAAGPAPSTRR